MSATDTDREYLDALRRQLHNLEASVTTFNDVLMRTGKEREEAWRAVMSSLVMDFALAVYASVDTTPEQRAYWLHESQPEASQ